MPLSVGLGCLNRGIYIFANTETMISLNYSHIGGCFNHTLGVKRYLTRYKHWVSLSS